MGQCRGIVRSRDGDAHFLHSRPCTGWITQRGTDVCAMAECLFGIRSPHRKRTRNTVVMGIGQETQTSGSGKNHRRRFTGCTNSNPVAARVVLPYALCRGIGCVTHDRNATHRSGGSATTHYSRLIVGGIRIIKRQCDDHYADGIICILRHIGKASGHNGRAIIRRTYGRVECDPVRAVSRVSTIRSNRSNTGCNRSGAIVNQTHFQTTGCTEVIGCGYKTYRIGRFQQQRTCDAHRRQGCPYGGIGWCGIGRKFPYPLRRGRSIHGHGNTRQLVGIRSA